MKKNDNSLTTQAFNELCMELKKDLTHKARVRFMDGRLEISPLFNREACKIVIDVEPWTALVLFDDTYTIEVFQNPKHPERLAPSLRKLIHDVVAGKITIREYDKHHTSYKVEVGEEKFNINALLKRKSSLVKVRHFEPYSSHRTSIE